MTLQPLTFNVTGMKFKDLALITAAPKDRTLQTGGGLQPPNYKSIDCPAQLDRITYAAIYFCNVSIKSESSLAATFSTFANNRAEPIDGFLARNIGAWDMAVTGAREVAPTASTDFLSPAYPDAVISGGYTLTAAPTNDSVTPLRLSITCGGKAADLVVGQENSFDCPEGATANVSYYPSFMLARYFEAKIWPVTVLSGTQTAAGPEFERYIVNTQGKEGTSDYTFNLGYFAMFFTVPKGQAPVQIYINITPAYQFGVADGDGWEDSYAIATSVKTLLNFKATTPADANRPKQPTDSRFVVETGSGLKTACTKRSDGPIRITVPVTRVVGDVDSDNFQVSPHPGTVVSTNVTLRMAVYHQGLGASSATPRDHFLMNGKEGNPDGSPVFLTGPNGTWTVNTVTFPSTLTRFGRRIESEPHGQTPPEPGNNQIEIQVDPLPPGGTGPEQWCSVVDWVELSFDALAPVIFVHGNGQGDDGKGGDFWYGGVLGDRTQARLFMKTNVIDSFKEAGIPYDVSISMFTNTTEQHGDLLGKLIPQIASEFGARHVHLIAHSKGGLDTRDFMARTIPQNFGVLSFTTFSSPHQGSSGPDYQLDAVHANLAYSDDSTHTEIAAASPPGAGTDSLRVSTVARFNQKNIPMMPRSMTVDGESAPVKYTNVVADANLDDSTSVFGNPTISFDECEGLPGQPYLVPDRTWASIVEQLYRILGNVASTRVEMKSIPAGDGPGGQQMFVQIPVVKEVPTASFQPNDFCVTHASGSYLATTMGGDVFKLKANHSTVAGPRSAKIAIDAIMASQPMK
jgi:hypothetical protein